MDAMQEYRRWIMYPGLDRVLTEELTAMSDDKDEIYDRFYRHLSFGTGGLRGLLGAGTNRMNLYTVGRATQGLSNYLKGQKQNPTICIAFDTRNFSREFALHAALVLCANGVKTYLWGSVRPTPMLSYAVRHLSADAGIVITASHNPKEYNGYKVYGQDGGQITDKAAQAILAQINKVDALCDTRCMPEAYARTNGLLCDMPEEVDNSYYEKVKELVLRKDLLKKEAGSLKILYTPLHGSGNLPVRRVLQELGFSRTIVVPEQEQPDGNFPTAAYPNPEDPAVFQLAIAQATVSEPDLIFATDPDCDRIGVLVKNPQGEYTVLSGNQVGTLLSSYIIETRKNLGSLPHNAAIVKTIVTTDLAERICSANDVVLFNTLTGFKYIGEKIEEWEKNSAYTFVFGFEESYGYLAGTFVRDKDAVIAAALIAEMALYYKTRGMSLYDAMQEMYENYGYTVEKLISISMPGAEGQERIASILVSLRENYAAYFPGNPLMVVEDYELSQRVRVGQPPEPLHYPKSNVMKFIYQDTSWMVLRPSGTEPKIKVYLYAAGDSAQSAVSRMEELENTAKRILES